MPTALLAIGFVALAAKVNAYRPTRLRWLVWPSFFLSMMVIEQAGWWLGIEIAAAVGLVSAGALGGAAGTIGGVAGWTGLAMLAASWVALARIVVAAAATTDTLRAAGAAPGSPVPFPRSQVIFPLLVRHRRGVRRLANIVYAEVDGVRLRLDVHLPALRDQAAHPAGAAGAGARPPGRPGILQIHGGGWTIGDKRDEGLPLLGHLAANGWVGINANYRLSPKVAFPAHLHDVKRAIAWYREHAGEFGADPDFLCVTGGSAGAHLAALAALTSDDPAYQPGFEEADTSVRAAVTWYGVYDLTNRLGTWKAYEMRGLERTVMQRALADAPEDYARASPLDRIRPDAPPFLVLHGRIDVLAPVAEAREFVSRLRAVSGQPVRYVEFGLAQHGFDVLPSPRTARAVEAAERFLAGVHGAYLTSRARAWGSQRGAGSCAARPEAAD